MMDEGNLNIKKCVNALKAAKSDNEKFAALLMVPKVTESEKLTASDRTEILIAISLGFLLRLLKSKSVPEGCSEHVYKSVALSVLSGMITDPELALQTSLHRILPHVNDILQIDSRDVLSEYQQILDDVYSLLRVFVESPQGMEQLISHGCMMCLANVILAEGYGWEKAVDLSSAVINSTTKQQWKGHGETLHVLLEFFCYMMNQKQDQEKFLLCHRVAAILRCLHEENIPECSRKPWYKMLTNTLKEIFTSKIGEDQRDPALKLAAVAIDKLGVNLVLPPSVTDCKLLLIITHLCCIEVRMILENLTYNQIVEKADLLCACYHLLEHVIGHMTSSPSLLLDEKQILQLHSAMLGAFNAVIFFLKECSEDMENEEEDSLAQLPDPVVIATVRVLGAWLAEETSALKKRTYEILPFLLKVCKIQMWHSKVEQGRKKLTEKRVQFNMVERMDACSLKTDHEDGNKDPDSNSENKSQMADDTASENLCLENVNSALKQSEGENCDSGSVTTQLDIEVRESRDEMHREVHVDIVRFLLPGLCHLTSEDEPRNILLENKAQELFVGYFKDAVSLLLSLKDAPSESPAKSSVELLCGIFLNLTVLEPALVSQDQNFHKVTAVVVEASPLIGKLLSCVTKWTNMLTLGMFLLRNQAQLSWPDNGSLLQFFISVCQFVKGAYVKCEGNSDVLQVSEIYLDLWDDIAQLWFLCVQATSECVKLYPSLIAAILSTGLLPHLTKVLLSVQSDKCPADVVQSVLSLMTSLAQTDHKAKQVLLTTGAGEIARVYKSVELQRCLR